MSYSLVIAIQNNGHETRRHVQPTRTDLTSTQNEEKLTTADKIATEHGTSRATVERAGKLLFRWRAFIPVKKAGTALTVRPTSLIQITKQEIQMSTNHLGHNYTPVKGKLRLAEWLGKSSLQQTMAEWLADYDAAEVIS